MYCKNLTFRHMSVLFSSVIHQMKHNAHLELHEPMAFMSILLNFSPYAHAQMAKELFEKT